MNPYCESCFFLFKLFSSCPRSYIFSEGTAGEIIVELIWLLASLVPFIMYFSLVLFIIFGRTSRALFVLTNLAIQQLLNDIILKKVIAQSRPTGACSTDYGFPSGHSSFAAALITWLVLEWIMFHDKVPFKTSKGHVALRTFALITLPLVPISRHFLNYHTIEQICYGVLCGFVFATLHFIVVVSIIHRNDGKFWSTKMIAFLKKIKHTDNLLYYELIQESESSTQENLEAQQPESAKSKMVLPLRQVVKKLFWRTYMKVEQAKQAQDAPEEVKI